MPPLVVDCAIPPSAIPDFESRHKKRGCRCSFCWAQYTVESLHYVDDIDLGLSIPPTPPLVDTTLIWLTWPWTLGRLTHVFTALDLCAAGLGRCFVDVLGRASSILRSVRFNEQKECCFARRPTSISLTVGR